MKIARYFVSKKKRGLILLFGVIIFLSGVGIYNSNNLMKQVIKVGRNYEFFRNYRNRSIARKAIETYKKKKIIYADGLQSYTTSGDYLNYGKTHILRPSERIIFDNAGIPKVKYGDGFHYNPVTTAQYALAEYGKALNSSEADKYKKFLTISDSLIEMQGKDGAFHYEFEYQYYLNKEPFEAGWISGMAQGQALSVFARAWLVTHDEKYIQAGKKALAFCMLPIDRGGPMSTLEDLDTSLKDYYFFQEYISTPNNFTLNGFMFTLLGLYDWKEIIAMHDGQEKNPAKEMFGKGIVTLKTILPYYDIGGFSAYDLGFKTFKGEEPHIGIGYHATHIIQLHALYSVTKEQQFREFEMRWRQYVD